MGNPKIITDRVMQVPMETLFEVISDFKAYPEFVSEVVGVKIESKGTAAKTIVHFELELMKKFDYTLEFKITKPTEVAWKLVSSNFFKNNEGCWQLSAIDARSTQVHYELDVGFVFFVPGFISRKLTEVNLPKMFDNFEARTKVKVGKK